MNDSKVNLDTNKPVCCAVSTASTQWDVFIKCPLATESVAIDSCSYLADGSSPISEPSEWSGRRREHRKTRFARNRKKFKSIEILLCSANEADNELSTCDELENTKVQPHRKLQGIDDISTTVMYSANFQNKRVSSVTECSTKKVNTQDGRKHVKEKRSDETHDLENPESNKSGIHATRRLLDETDSPISTKRKEKIMDFKQSASGACDVEAHEYKTWNVPKNASDSEPSFSAYEADSELSTCEEFENTEVQPHHELQEIDDRSIAVVHSANFKSKHVLSNTEHSTKKADTQDGQGREHEKEKISVETYDLEPLESNEIENHVIRRLLDETDSPISTKQKEKTMDFKQSASGICDVEANGCKTFKEPKNALDSKPDCSETIDKTLKQLTRKREPFSELPQTTWKILQKHNDNEAHCKISTRTESEIFKTIETDDSNIEENLSGQENITPERPSFKRKRIPSNEDCERNCKKPHNNTLNSPTE